MIDLTPYSRRRYTQGFTAFHKLERLTQILGGPNIYIKRDDCLGLAGGGNKTRKLEFVVADALAQKADTLITCASVQSNHCRLTLSAASIEGLKCRLALEQRVPGSYDSKASGNNFLFHLLGVEQIEVYPGGTDMDAAMAELAEKATGEGRNVYVITLGAGTPLGVLGYVACAHEILAQAYDQGVQLDAIVHATGGSGGTQAGLLIGLLGSHQPIPVIGICSGSEKSVQIDRVDSLAHRTMDFLQVPDSLSRNLVTCYDDYIGPGYSLPTPEMAEAVTLMASTEGILLDPVYTGKAMAGLIDLIRNKHFTRGQNVLFLHTGGTPALYHFTSTFFREQRANNTADFE